MNIDPRGMDPLAGNTAGAASAAGRTATKADAVSRQAADQAPVSPAGATDLSSRAAEFLKIQTKLAAAAPPSRDDRIAALQALIASGEYTVDSTRIADGMLQDEGISRALGLPSR
jgi:negative regulator of flagellin synthesis FlgM